MVNKVHPSYDTKRIVLGKALPLEAPFRVTIDSSEVCNFRCNYCFRSEPVSSNWGYAQKNQIMEWDTFTRIVEQLKEFPTEPKVIALSGSGEPLCNKKIPQMAHYIKEIGFHAKTEMHTNAALLTEDNVKNIAQSGIDKIVISLQGLSKEDYKKVCRTSIDFDAFYKRLEELYKYKSSNTVINIKIVREAFERPEQEEIFYKLFSPIADNVFVENVIALWQQQKKYDDAANVESNKFGANLGDINRCPILFTNLTISPEGNIWPCCVIDPPFCLGNVNQISLLQAWNSQQRREFMKKNLLEGHMCHEKCSICYFPKGYVKTEEDIIDPYYLEILDRLES